MRLPYRLTAVVSYFGRHYSATVDDVGATRATVEFNTKAGRTMRKRLPYAPVASVGRAHVVRLYGPRNVRVQFTAATPDGHPPCAHFVGGRRGDHSVRLDRRDKDRLAIHLRGYIDNQL